MLQIPKFPGFILKTILHWHPDLHSGTNRRLYENMQMWKRKREESSEYPTVPACCTGLCPRCNQITLMVAFLLLGPFLWLLGFTVGANGFPSEKFNMFHELVLNNSLCCESHQVVLTVEILLCKWARRESGAFEEIFLAFSLSLFKLGL